MYIERQGVSMREVERKTMQLPKNFRQVGEPRLNKRIYIEDYVVTYLTELAQPKNIYARGAILLGTVEETKDGQAIFVKGALEAQNLELDLDETIFSNEIWAEIRARMKKYFPDLKIVGWFLSRIGFSVDLNDKIVRTHIENFQGENKILYMMDTLEEEDAFYVFEKGELRRSDGYYIYYEKNEKMQEYMILQGEGSKKKTSENKETPIIKRDESVLKTYRNRIKSKKKQKKNQKKVGKLYAAVGSCAVLAVIFGFLLFSQGDREENAMASISNIFSESSGINLNTDSNTNTNSDIDSDVNSDINSIEETWNVETDGQDDESNESSESNVGSEGEEDSENDGNKNGENGGNSEEDASKARVTTAIEKETKEELETSNFGNVQEENLESKSTQAENTSNRSNQIQTKKVNPEGKVGESSQSGKSSDIGQQIESEETMGTAGVYYTVKAGDTLAAISNRIYNSMDYVEEIAQLNKLSDLNKIYPGQKLQLPQRE